MKVVLTKKHLITLMRRLMIGDVVINQAARPIHSIQQFFMPRAFVAGDRSVRLIIVNSNITAPHHNTQQDLLLTALLSTISGGIFLSCQRLQLKCFHVIKPCCCSISTTDKSRHLHFYASRHQIKKAKRLGRWKKVQILDLCL